MSLDKMIQAARSRNANDFGEHFNSVVNEKLTEALKDVKADVIRNMFAIEDCDDDDKKEMPFAKKSDEDEDGDEGDKNKDSDED